MNASSYTIITPYTSAGYALAKDTYTGRVCVIEGECVLYVSEYEDLWYEYPKGTWQKALYWITPDRLAFFRNGFWGVRKPDGEIIIPDEFDTILNYKQSGYFIVRDKSGKVGCVDADFQCVFPCEYDWITIREKVEKLIKHTNE